MASTAIASIIFIQAAFLCLASGEILTNLRLLAGDQKAWLSSPNGKFAFGFDGSAIPGGNKYLLAIWFAQLPGDRTLVWSPNRNFPVGDSASLEFSPSGDLLLVDGNNVTVWSSNTSGLGARVAVLLDTGNFILYNDSSHRPLWQSFQHPSDTLLPNQQLTVSQQLTASRPSDEDGRYTLGMVQETDLLSLTLTYSLSSLGNYSGSNYSYWVGPDMSNVTGTVIAVLDDSGSFGIVYGDSADGAVFIHQNDGDAKGLMLSVRNGSTGSPYLRRLTLEANGSLRLYRWDDNVNGSSQWVPEWAAVSNPCDIAGMCGNGVCSFDKTIPNATCKPLPGFARGRSGTVNESGLCPEYKRSDFKISVIKQTNYYFSDFSVIANYSDELAVSKCGDVCLSDCECIASVSGMDEEAPYCWLLRSLDFGGFEDSGSTLFVKVRSDSLLAGTTKDVVIPTVAVMAVLLLLLCALLYYSVCKRQYLWSSTECSLLHLSGAPINFSYRDLQIRTSNFSLLLGTGGFGSVYKGSLVDGTLVAVKKLERVLPHGEKEFVTEVNTIGSMHHMNLVRLCGYCSDGPQRLLVYEFMKNGSLDKWIFPSPASSNERLLDWETRFNIAMRTAQGIAYFHEQCRNRIIHCDIKPENILLDENFCPKVSDFGLAKLMGREHLQVMTMVRGTRGYLAPEWISNRPITVKADVYSYGMLLLEIIGGRRNLDMALDVDNFFYPSLAFKEMMNKTPINVADRRLSKVVKEVELLRALKVAFWCIQDEVFSRPTMGEVIRMLEGLVDVNTPPMPQTVLELVEEGLDQVYRAMRREIGQSGTCTFSTTHLTLLAATQPCHQDSLMKKLVAINQEFHYIH